MFIFLPVGNMICMEFVGAKPHIIKPTVVSPGWKEKEDLKATGLQSYQQLLCRELRSEENVNKLKSLN